MLTYKLAGTTQETVSDRNGPAHRPPATPLLTKAPPRRSFLGSLVAIEGNLRPCHLQRSWDATRVHPGQG